MEPVYGKLAKQFKYIPVKWEPFLMDFSRVTVLEVRARKMI